MAKGMVHVYTGDGKGKTTAAAGLAARALGQGLRVAFFQFLKTGLSGEVISLAQLGAEVFAPQGSGKFVWEMDDVEKAACAQQQQSTMERAFDMAPEFDLLVLDEVVCAVEAGLLALEDLRQLLEDRPEELEVVLTGRGADEELLQLGDYVTEMKMLAHPFELGQAARRGVEF